MLIARRRPARYRLGPAYHWCRTGILGLLDRPTPTTDLQISYGFMSSGITYRPVAAFQIRWGD